MAKLELLQEGKVLTAAPIRNPELVSTSALTELFNLSYRASAELGSGGIALTEFDPSFGISRELLRAIYLCPEDAVVSTETIPEADPAQGILILNPGYTDELIQCVLNESCLSIDYGASVYFIRRDAYFCITGWAYQPGMDQPLYLSPGIFQVQDPFTLFPHEMIHLDGQTALSPKQLKFLCDITLHQTQQAIMETYDIKDPQRILELTDGKPVLRFNIASDSAEHIPSSDIPIYYTH